MKAAAKSVLVVAFAILCLTVTSCEQECVQGQIQECTCPDRSVSEQMCSSSSGEWLACICEGGSGGDADADADADTDLDGGMDAGDDAGN